jgi:argonaute-like protein implicated in RNA metabolism and viral defense
MKLVKDENFQRKELKNENNAYFTPRITQETMQSTDIKTKTKVIVLALQGLIKRNKVAALKSYKGKINLDIDIDSLRKRNAHSDR